MNSRELSIGTRSSLLARVLTWRSEYVLLAALGPGLTLIVGSILLNIHELMLPGTAPFQEPPAVPREVGYLSALNWSVTYALLFPIVLALIVEVLQRMCDTLDRLVEHRMVRDHGLQNVTSNCLSTDWIRGTPWRSRFLWGFAFTLPVVLSFSEWFTNNLLRLLGSGPPTSAADYDWGLAGIIQHWSFPWLLTNAFFDLVAFCCQGALLGSLIAFFIHLLDLGRVLPRRSRDSAYLLVPNLLSDDPRRGFEEFAEPLQLMLVVALLSFLICYLIRIHGVYLAGTTARSLQEFVMTDIGGGVRQALRDPKHLGAAVVALFEAGPGSRQSFLAWTASVIVLFFSLVVTVTTVRTVAGAARNNARLHYSHQPTTALFSDSPSAEREALRGMTLWPLGYLRLDLLLIGGGFVLTVLYFYRVGLFIFGGVLGSLILRILTQLRKWSKKD